MDIQVTQAKFTKYDKHRTGGASAVIVLDISVDSSLPMEQQRGLVIHEVIEGYCRNWAHEQVEELEQLITYALGQLGG